MSTAKFEDFITEFLNRTFQMIDNLSTEMSDAVVVSSKINVEDHVTELALTSMMFGIVQQCSTKIFNVSPSNILISRKRQTLDLDGSRENRQFSSRFIFHA